MDTEGNFLNHQQLQTKYNIICNFLQCLQIRQSIPTYWRQIIYDNPESGTSLTEPFVSLRITPNKTNIVPISKTTTKQIYLVYVRSKYQLPRCVQKWQQIYTDLNEWQDIFTRSFSTSWETKIQSFQYKIIHNIINNNKKLFDWRIKDSPACDYCTNAEDNSPHYFVKCPNVNRFWTSFFQWWNLHVGDQFHYPDYPNEKEILFGVPLSDDNSIVLNFCIIYGKFYIYKQRLFGGNLLSLDTFLAILRFQLQIEEKIHISNDRPDNFDKFVDVFRAVQQWFQFSWDAIHCFGLSTVWLG